jgi:ketosteroid isomerase-like protein
VKTTLVLCALVMFSCGKTTTTDQGHETSLAETQIQAMVTSLYEGYARAYNEGGISTDSLIDAYYDKGIHYVTPWGWTEPIDSTKARLRRAVSLVKQYSAHLEAWQVKSYGDGAYAFFILRQSTIVDGKALDEYLPTTFILERRGTGWKIVHAHRSTDYETFQQYVALQTKSSAGK